MFVCIMRVNNAGIQQLDSLNYESWILVNICGNFLHTLTSFASFLLSNLWVI